MSNNIASDARFSRAQKELVAFVAGAIIPEDTAQGMPGANSPQVLQDILHTSERQSLELCEYVEAVSKEVAGCGFQDLDTVQMRELANYLANSNVQEVQGFEGLVVQCYYRDDRVLAALGMEARAPFPQGYEVAAGDWELLDTVKRRPPFYRAV